MGYRLDWRLLGRDNRLLDSGEIDSGFRDRRSALEALGAFLRQFAHWGRASERDRWWAKRFEDADLKVLPGFKWSSQHLERGGCDGHSEAAFGSVRARRVALAWSALCCAA